MTKNDYTLVGQVDVGDEDKIRKFLEHPYRYVLVPDVTETYYNVWKVHVGST